MTQLTSYAA